MQKLSQIPQDIVDGKFKFPGDERSSFSVMHLFDKRRYLEEQLWTAQRKGLINQWQVDRAFAIFDEKRKERRKLSSRTRKALAQVLEQKKRYERFIPSELLKNSYASRGGSNSRSNNNDNDDGEDSDREVTHFEHVLDKTIDRIHAFQDLYEREPTSMRWDRIQHPKDGESKDQKEEVTPKVQIKQKTQHQIQGKLSKRHRGFV